MERLLALARALPQQERTRPVPAPKGANTCELMERMGHVSERAALTYLHSSPLRQRDVADAVGDAARAELAKSKTREAARPSGTRMTRNRRSAGEDGK